MELEPVIRSIGKRSVQRRYQKLFLLLLRIKEKKALQI